MMGYLAFGRDEVGEKARLYFGRGKVDVVFGVVVVVLPASVVEVVVLLLVCVGCEIPFLSFFLILILPLARKSSHSPCFSFSLSNVLFYFSFFIQTSYSYNHHRSDSRR